MQLPLQITARDFPLTSAIESAIRMRAGKLEHFCNCIMGCKVSLETPHKHHHKGTLYNVRLRITVPGDELVVKREPHTDMYVAIRDAFDAAKRQLQAYMRKRRGDVKLHEEAPTARIAELIEEDGYGFISTPDGREIYFHGNSVLNRPFRQLRRGDVVRFVEERGDRGPQASTITVI